MRRFLQRGCLRGGVGYVSHRATSNEPQKQGMEKVVFWKIGRMNRSAPNLWPLVPSSQHIPLSVSTAISVKAQISGLGQGQGCGKVGMRFPRGVEAFLEKTPIAYRPNRRQTPNFRAMQQQSFLKPLRHCQYKYISSTGDIWINQGDHLLCFCGKGEEIWYSKRDQRPICELRGNIGE